MRSLSFSLIIIGFIISNPTLLHAWSKSDRFKKMCKKYEIYRDNRRQIRSLFSKNDKKKSLFKREMCTDKTKASPPSYLDVVTGIAEQAVEEGDCSVFLYQSRNEVSFVSAERGKSENSPICECFTCTERGFRTFLSELTIKGRYKKRAKEIIEKKVGEFFRGQIYTLLNNGIYLDNLIKNKQNSACGNIQLDSKNLAQMRNCRLSAILQKIDKIPPGCDEKEYKRKLALLLDAKGLNEINSRSNTTLLNSENYKNIATKKFHNMIKNLTNDVLRNNVIDTQQNNNVCLPYKAFVSMTSPVSGRHEILNNNYLEDNLAAQSHQMRRRNLVSKYDFETFLEKINYIYAKEVEKKAISLMKADFLKEKMKYLIEKNLFNRDPFLQIIFQDKKMYKELYNYVSTEDRDLNLKRAENLEEFYCKKEEGKYPIIDKLIGSQNTFCKEFRDDFDESGKSGKSGNSKDTLNSLQKEFLCKKELPTFSPQFYNSHIHPAIKNEFKNKGDKIAKYIQRRNFCEIDRSGANEYIAKVITEDAYHLEKVLNPSIISNNDILNMAEGNESFYEDFNKFFCSELMKGECQGQSFPQKCRDLGYLKEKMFSFYQEQGVRFIKEGENLLIQDLGEIDPFENRDQLKRQRNMSSIERLLFGPSVPSETERGNNHLSRRENLRIFRDIDTRSDDIAADLFLNETGENENDTLFLDYMVHGTESDEDMFQESLTTTSPENTPTYQRRGFQAPSITPDPINQIETIPGENQSYTSIPDGNTSQEINNLNQQVDQNLNMNPSSSDSFRDPISNISKKPYTPLKNPSKNETYDTTQPLSQMDENQTTLTQSIDTSFSQTKQKGLDVNDQRVINQVEKVEKFEEIEDITKVEETLDELKTYSRNNSANITTDNTSFTPLGSTEESMSDNLPNQNSVNRTPASSRNNETQNQKLSDGANEVHAQLVSKTKNDKLKHRSDSLKSSTTEDQSKEYDFLKQLYGFNEDVWKNAIEEEMKKINSDFIGFPGLKGKLSHFIFEHFRIVPHILFERFGKDNVIKYLKLEGKTFSSLRMTKNKNKYSFSVYVYGFNPSHKTFLALNSKSEISKRIRLIKIITNLRKLNNSHKVISIVREKMNVIEIVELSNQKLIQEAIERLVSEELTKQTAIHLSRK